MMTITFENGGEVQDIQVPEGTTIQKFLQDRGISNVTVLLNGTTTGLSTTLREDDALYVVPKSGKQGLKLAA